MKTKARTRSRQQQSPGRTADAFFAQESTSAGFFDTPAPSPSFGAPTVLQRKCAACKDEEKHSNQQAPASADKSRIEQEKDKKISRKESSDGTATAPATSMSGVNGSGGDPLPAASNEYFSNALDYDFSDVRVHTGPDADRSAQAVKARAYTIGQHIVFREGQFQPADDQGRWLLAHELTHVAQQNGRMIQRQAEGADEDAPQQIFNSGVGPVGYDNQRDYANCENVSVQGYTDANYTDTHSFASTAQAAENCSGCAAEDCVTASGTVVSTFGAAPAVTLPSVPAGLNECETAAVQNYIDTTLSAHEQQHVAAFNTYVGTVRTPYTYTGCKSGEGDFVKARHDEIKNPRMAASNALSAQLDPFNQVITCECPDPEPEPAEPDTPPTPAPETGPESE